jgi:hypothetical protein
MRRSILCLGILAIAACSRKQDATPGDTTPRDTTPAAPVQPDTGPPPYPLVGVAVRDRATTWCGEFPVDSTIAAPVEGDTVAIVFTADQGPAAMYARLGAPRDRDCHTAFPQPRWFTYRAFDLMLAEPAPEIAEVALAVVSPARWTRRNGRVSANLDGGAPEEVRRCVADEGEHFTIWSVERGKRPVRRSHEYIDWGAETLRTCKAGEDGR